MEDEVQIDEASVEREKQRSESEARSIIHDIEKLYTLPDEKKSRWIWELLQNAKDVAKPDGVDIQIKLTPQYIEFAHNGLPFRTKHLLALLYKTSTKSLSGNDGTTGKYGTGFVTTHILNKKLSIAGIHENDGGKRRFTIEIDRTAAGQEEDKALAAIQESLAITYNTISAITKRASENIESNWHTFSYGLKADTYNYAESGLLELERNLAFTMLVNSSKLKSVSVEVPSGQKLYVAKDQETLIVGIRFISLEAEIGLLYQKIGKLIFGVPAKRRGENYSLLPIKNQAILFKEFPLIGTEGFNLPVFIQHEEFHPREERDAIRTKINSEEDQDPTAERNRKGLTDFVDAFIPFASKIIDAEFPGAYLLAKSGLPEFVDIFSNRNWFEKNIQKPIREMILQKLIVTTCSGLPKQIANAKFILNDFQDANAFFELASKLIPEQIPDKDSIWHWSDIISQEINEWPDNIILQVEDMVKLVPGNVNLANESSFEWLKELYQFLDKNNLSYLSEKYPIYPNEAGNFCLRDDVAIHPNIDDEFKTVSRGLGRPLEKEFLNRKVGKVTAIKTFDLLEFYKQLNNELIGDLKVESASVEQVKAIFRVCCLFRSDRAFRREEWFKIINQLLPDLAAEKKLISVDYENYGRSAESWSIKYVSNLIERAGKPTLFAQAYFEGNIDLCFLWLNDFIGYVFALQEDNKDVVLKKRILPTQSDDFRSYDDFIFAEQDSKYFDITIKDIYRDHTKRGDPRKFIIDTHIKVEGIRKREVSVLTGEIDNLFHDELIESKIKKGGSLNEMFLKLNDWFERFSTSSVLLPIFSTKRASLYVIALGEGFSKQIMEIRNAGKSMDDLTELAKIKLSTTEMKFFDSAASELGAEKLRSKTLEMLEAKRLIDRWKTIGKAAETAFKEALSFIEPDFEILNPDIGKDFVIVVNGKQYSIEIKSVDFLKGNVNMSLLQGKTAVLEKDNYALCVLTRPEDDSPVGKDYFIDQARFVPDIGYKIGDCIERWYDGLRSLDTNTDVKVTLDEKTESVYISRNIWKSGLSFDQFISILKLHFSIGEIKN